jgi:hypothetical protein
VVVTALALSFADDSFDAARAELRRAGSDAVLRRVAWSRSVGRRLQDHLARRQDAMAQYPAKIDLSSLDGSDGFNLTGVVAADARSFLGLAGNVRGTA